MGQRLNGDGYGLASAATDISAISGLAFQPPADLEDFFVNGPVPLHIVGGDGVILRANKAELDFLGYSAAEFIGRYIADFHVDQLIIEDILDRLAHGEKLEGYPARLRAKDGSIKHVEITSSGKFVAGRLVQTRCFSFDVTKLRAAEAQIQHKDSQLKQILDALPVAVYTTDKDGSVTYFNAAAEHLAGRRPVIGKDQWCVTWRLRDQDGRPLPLEECPMAIALKESRPVRGVRAFAERPDGSLVPFAPYPTPLFDGEGQLAGAVNMLVDLTDQSQREQHINFVMRELCHRSKNLLAIVQAVANRTARNSATVDEFQSNFLSRVQAMSRTHDVLVRNDWGGAKMREIVEGELEAFDGTCFRGRVEIIGDDLYLTPSLAQNINLAIHELATNSMKYGVMVGDEGRVAVKWEPKGPNRFELSWSETSPTARTADALGNPGFGTSMLRSLFDDATFHVDAQSFRFSGLFLTECDAPSADAHLVSSGRDASDGKGVPLRPGESY